jgi:hypothetical protein
MAEETYEAPRITVLGDITDMTQAKPGFFFDFGNASEGSKTSPPGGSPGTGTS